MRSLGRRVDPNLGLDMPNGVSGAILDTNLITEMPYYIYFFSTPMKRLLDGACVDS